MEQFKIRQGGFNEIRKQVLFKTIPLVIIAVAVGLGAYIYNSEGLSSNLSVIPIVIPIILGAVGYGLYTGINRQKQLFESYTLTISEGAITREQSNTPTLIIAFSDIHEITKHNNGNFTIKSRNQFDSISIPVQIENYQELEASLNNIRPLSTLLKAPLSQKLSIPLTIASLALMFTVYTVSNKILVLISGVVLSSIITWSFIQIQKTKNIDNKTKNGSYWLILVILSVIGITVYKLL